MVIGNSFLVWLLISAKQTGRSDNTHIEREKHGLVMMCINSTLKRRRGLKLKLATFE